MRGPKVAVAMGSESDRKVMEEAGKLLERFGIEYELVVCSAHRTPGKTRQYARSLEGRGVKVVIAGAGMAAHLPGAIASETTLPVIGVPLAGSALGGVDALYSMVQMPAGVPVATMAIGSAGARNGAILAAQILALSDEKVRQELESYKRELAGE